MSYVTLYVTSWLLGYIRYVLRNALRYALRKYVTVYVTVVKGPRPRFTLVDPQMTVPQSNPNKQEEDPVQSTLPELPFSSQRPAPITYGWPQLRRPIEKPQPSHLGPNASRRADLRVHSICHISHSSLFSRLDAGHLSLETPSETATKWLVAYVRCDLAFQRHHGA